jgi:hypothetical protein
MIISEKQILALMIHVRSYIELLKISACTKSGQANLESAIELMNNIQSQQCKELREIE